MAHKVAKWAPTKAPTNPKPLHNITEKDFTPEMLKELPVLIKKWTDNANSTEPASFERAIITGKDMFYRRHMLAPTMWVFMHSVVTAGAFATFLKTFEKSVKIASKKAYTKAYYVEMPKELIFEEKSLGMNYIVNRIRQFLWFGATGQTGLLHDWCRLETGPMLGRLQRINADLSKAKDIVVALSELCIRYTTGDNEPKLVHSDVVEQVAGTYESEWFPYHELLNKHWGCFEDMEPVLELMANVSWAAPYEDVMIFQDRPATIHRDTTGRIHHPTDAAVKYRDGLSLYMWRDIAVPYFWYTEGLTSKQALEYRNAELRRAACEFLGYAKIIKDLKAKEIDRHKDPEMGVLYLVDFPTIDGEISKDKFLHVVEGHSGREFMIPVPPEMTTVIQAQAWLTAEPEDTALIEGIMRQ